MKQKSTPEHPHVPHYHVLIPMQETCIFNLLGEQDTDERSTLGVAATLLCRKLSAATVRARQKSSLMWGTALSPENIYYRP
jgi:hypothetical protein